MRSSIKRNRKKVIKNNHFGGNYKDNPKYLSQEARARRYLQYQKTSADYRLFTYDISPAILMYLQEHADAKGVTIFRLLHDLGINPDYIRKVAKGAKVCSYDYAMFLVSRIGEPITLIA